MKNLIILISMCFFFNLNAQRLGPEEYFTYVALPPAVEYIENQKGNEIDTLKLKESLVTLTKSFLDKEGLDFDRHNLDLVVNPINLMQADFYTGPGYDLKILNLPKYDDLRELYRKVTEGFERLNITLNDRISFEDVEVKYNEGKWFQAINEIEKAEYIFSCIEGLKFEDNRLQFVHASRIRLAQIKSQKGSVNEALNVLYKVNDRELMKFSPYDYYDSSFDYNGIEPSKRLISHILKTSKK